MLLLQETKTSEPLDEAVNLTFTGQKGTQKYGTAWCFASRKGYAGTMCLFKAKPLSIRYGMNSPSLDTEGRLITLEYPDYYVLNAYVPNSQANLARKYFRMEWDKFFCEHVCGLLEELPVIIGGDFNVARDYIDIFPENLRNSENPPGFTDEERDGLEILLKRGFTDVYRHFYQTTEGVYTWWSNRLNKRAENRGWRIDYFLVSNSLISKVKSIVHRTDIYGSDHCPIELTLGA